MVYSGLALLATLSHAGLMALLFVMLAEGIRRTWPRSSAAYAAAGIDRPGMRLSASGQ